MTVWLAFVLGGLVTFAIRASFLVFLVGHNLPASAERALRYVGPAAFGAIVLPAALGDDGFSSLASPGARVFALVAGGLIMWRTRNVVAGLALGMIALWVLRSLGL